jgi:uncharacterized membrane protein YkgB
MPLPAPLDSIDRRIAAWMGAHGITLTRLSLGIVFLWFGVLKFFPGLSSAETLATDTIARLTGGNVPRPVAMIALATWEVLIGLGLLSGRFLRITLGLLFLQMPGTLLPLVFFPDETFVRFPIVPTLEGQYIIKNLVLISAAIVVGATVRGGGMREGVSEKR